MIDPLNISSEQATEIIPVVQLIQDLLDEQRRWTQREDPMDNRENSLKHSRDPSLKLDLLGAMNRAAQEVALGDIAKHQELLDQVDLVLKSIIRRTYGSWSLVVFNDTRSFEEIHHLLQNANNWLTYIARGCIRF